MLWFVSDNLLPEHRDGRGGVWSYCLLGLLVPVLGELLLVAFPHLITASSLAWLWGGYIWPGRLYLFLSHLQGCYEPRAILCVNSLG